MDNPLVTTRLLISLNFVSLLALGAVSIKEDYFRKSVWVLTGTHTPVTETAHFKQMISIQRRRSEQAIKGGANVQIALIGDSIIEGWLTSASIAQSMNLGIGRDTIPGMLSRTEAELLRHIPDWYIGIGINDALRGQNPEKIPIYVGQIAHTYREVDRLFWRVALPVQGERWNEANEDFRQTLNSEIRAACSAMSNCTFLDVPNGYNANVATWTSDGLHPNAAGYRALTEQLCEIADCLEDIR